MRSIVEEEEKEGYSPGTDTEITLGMKSLLGVFFGAVLVCGIFFGFGYSLGRSSAHPGAAIATPSPAIAVAPSTGSDTARPSPTESPSAQSPAAGDSDLKTVVSDDSAEPSSSVSGTQPSQSPTAKTQPQYEYVPTPDGPARRPVGAPNKSATKASGALAAATPAPIYAKPSAAVVRQSPDPAATSSAVTPRSEPAALTATRSASPTSSQYAATATGSDSASPTMVQIAAVTHQEDANILVSALKKRGYAVLVRTEPKDSLLHVQIGPFGSRDEARAMRARLLADGYNAILK